MCTADLLKFQNSNHDTLQQVYQWIQCGQSNNKILVNEKEKHSKSGEKLSEK